MKIYGVTGWKNSGKTGLMERLVVEFNARGFSVSTIKHAHHSFDVDQPGKDSFRHRKAGAKEVLLASPNRFVLMNEFCGEEEPTLADLLPKLSSVDLVLIEGYKIDRHPKIGHRKTNAVADNTIRAVASNDNPSLDKPVFDLDETGSIADFIQAETGL